MTPAELHALADAIGPEWRAMVYLSGVMGLRFGEVAALQVADIDFDRQRLSITKAVAEGAGRLTVGPPKTASSNRTLDLPDQLVEEIRQHVDLLVLSQPTDLLFADHFGGPLSEQLS